MAKLSELQQRVLAYIEQVFYETGHVPTVEILARDLVLQPSVLNNFYKNEDFKAALVARGVDFDPDKTDKILEPKQILLANMMMNTLDKNSLREKLKMIGVTTQQYQAWRRQPAFQNYLRRRSEQVFKDSDTEAYLGLSKAVATGDINAIKFHFEMRGIYNPKLQVDVNIEHVIVRVVDIVAKHVSPEVMEAIGAELEMLMGGTAPAIEAAVQTKEPDFSLQI